MYNIVIVQVVDGFQNFLDSPGSILFCKLSVLADAVEELASSCQLCDDVIFVLSDP